MLLERVRHIKSKFNTYIIDSIAQNAGHIILRLPPFHYELNPIELAWPMVKQYVKQNNTTSKLSDVRNLLNVSHNSTY
jgi:transposase